MTHEENDTCSSSTDLAQQTPAPEQRPAPQRILETTCSQLADVGEEGVSTRGIAAGAGVSPATIHHYYGSKEGLLDACIEIMYDDIERESAEWLESYSMHNDVERAVNEVVRGGYRIARRHKAVARVLLRRVTSVGQLDQPRIEHQLRPALVLVSTLLRKHTRRSEDDIRIHCASMFFLITRFAIGADEERAAVFEGVRSSPDSMIEDYLVSIALAGIQ